MSKESFLLRFQENGANFNDGFDLEDDKSSSLSYSRFSAHSSPLKQSQKNVVLDHPPKSASSAPPMDSIPEQDASPFFSGATATPRRAPKKSNRANNGHTRKPSVKMSLTPAQRVEKKPGLRTQNALDDFVFQEKVGRGAHADVYKGVNLKTGQVVAIKQIALDRDHDITALMGEIDLLKILKHQYIVKYHGFVKTLNSLNVFLEFCAGGSLRQLYKTRRRGLSEPDIISYVVPILHGLSYLHEQGVVHRDVKAANVLLTELGEVKLADFGVATKVATLQNTVVGTPNWMAPETVLGGEGICTASDVWSLGATIIELFTTNPPYHDLNPMATLHAIGTDDHPPLPTGLTPPAKDFLLECFQKQPTLRISAKNLLKHKWITQDPLSKKWRPPLTPTSSALYHQSSSFPSLPETPQKRFTRSELLSKFHEDDEDVAIDPADSTRLVSLKISNNANPEPHENPSEENDPFLELDIDNFDTNEIEIQSKMELLAKKLMSRVGNAHTGHEDTINSLIKVTGRMLQLVKKYPILHDTLIRHHGVLTLLELLENAPEITNQNRLWYHVLAVLNHIFETNLAQVENFALLGGIPMITQFSKLSYGLSARLQVVKFIKIIRKSDRALLMFVSSGGLRILSRFLEEDFDATPDFPLVAIHCIHEILAKDLTRFKSDMCRILSKYGVVFWFVVLLNRLTKYNKSSDNVVPADYVEVTIDKILEVLMFFSHSEPRVRINISNPDMIKLLIKVYPSVEFPRQLTILKFFKAISCISSLLRILYSADILEFLISVLRDHPPLSAHYKEVLNTVCPSLYNCCYLNHTKEIEVIKLGILPIFKNLYKINLPSRQFVLPLLCEFVYCDGYVRQMLGKYDILNVYLSLLVDPYWHSNAMDSLLYWASQDPQLNWLDPPRAHDCLVGGFLLGKISNLEAVLNNYLHLVSTNDVVVELMARDAVINHILSMLTVYQKNAVVKVSLLRILTYILMFVGATNNFNKLSSINEIQNTVDDVRSAEPSVLIRDLADKISRLLQPLPSVLQIT